MLKIADAQAAMMNSLRFQAVQAFFPRLCGVKARLQ